MSERRVADVVQQGHRFDQVLIEPQCAPNRPSQGSDFVGMGQACSVVISHIARENLHLSAQSAESGTVQDAITIALKWAAIVMLRLGMLAPGRLCGEHGKRCKQEPLSRLPRQPGIDISTNQRPCRFGHFKNRVQIPFGTIKSFRILSLTPNDSKVR